MILIFKESGKGIFFKKKSFLNFHSLYFKKFTKETVSTLFLIYK